MKQKYCFKNNNGNDFVLQIFAIRAWASCWYCREERMNKVRGGEGEDKFLAKNIPNHNIVTMSCHVIPLDDYTPTITNYIQCSLINIVCVCVSVCVCVWCMCVCACVRDHNTNQYVMPFQWTPTPQGNHPTCLGHI